MPVTHPNKNYDPMAPVISSSSGLHFAVGKVIVAVIFLLYFPKGRPIAMREAPRIGLRGS